MTTKTKTDCKTKGLCHYDALTRTKFFHGMLLTDEHLRAEQVYTRESLKRLNRHLWGAGIVCGLEVEHTSGLCIKVHPGLALDCDGNVIDACKCVTIDLGDVCKKKYPDGCTPADAEKIEKYLVIRFAEVPADPQPVLTPEDDCTPASDRPKCEASKYREGFCLEFRDKCPDCEPCEEEEKSGTDGLVPALFKLEDDPAGDDEIQEKLDYLAPSCMTSPPCPDCHCCEDAAVGLAKLTIDCDKNTVEVECECRHFVWSPRLLQWLICGLFGNIHKLSKNRTGLKDALPAASAFVRNPMKTSWDVGGLALRSRGAARIKNDLDGIRARLAVVEKQMKKKP